MTRTSVMVTLAFVALPVAGSAQQPAPTNSIGMEFVRIQPGTMQVGVYHPECPDPSAPVGRAGTAAARGADQGRGSDTGRGGGRGAAPQDPRSQWSDADYKTCQELAPRDSTAGFSVTIGRAFDIGKYEVTQAQWKRVMGTNPSTFQGTAVADDPDRHPVESITWQQVQAFIAKLNRLEKTSAYRLPTEFEWEYAGRAGSHGQTPWPEIRETAVISSPGRGGDGAAPAPQTTSMVGTKKPNAWGLYDMLGNVWEWVADYYNDKMFADPTPPKTGIQHVLKGCGFGAADVGNCIYATHGAGPADVYDVGFRLVREVR